MSNKKKHKQQINNLPASPTNQIPGNNQNNIPLLKKPTFTAVSQSFSGPVPPPEIIEAYNSIVPGSGKMIFDMALSQQSHRQSLENKVIEADIKNSKRGSWFGFILGIIGFLVSAFALYLGHPATASVIGGASLVSLAGVFVYGTKSRKAERNQKAGINSEDKNKPSPR